MYQGKWLAEFDCHCLICDDSEYLDGWWIDKIFVHPSEQDYSAPVGQRTKYLEVELTKEGNAALYDDVMAQIDGYDQHHAESAWWEFVGLRRSRLVA
jgi:hypothetical protein